MTADYFARHRATLEAAVEATRRRGYWSPYSESPKAYGENAVAEGEAAFTARLGKPLDLGQPTAAGWVGNETSPFGPSLGITYPRADVDALVRAAQAAMPAWRDAGVEGRVGVCLEILDRLSKRTMEIAHAVMHTTGQAFMMAFQAGGPHAQDRGLEAVAYAYDAMHAVPSHVTWEKPQGKGDPVRIAKTYRIMPRGIGLVIGCSTFPTWNGYPGLFASLATGNPVIVKPHPGAILPLAITVETARQVLREAGLPADVVTLAADGADAPVAKELAMRPEIAVIDFTGSSAFGRWLEENARHAQVYTEKAGVNFVVIDSTDDLKGMLGNLAFSLSLYSGQMCTTPQNIFVPRGGIQADGGHITSDEVTAAIGQAVDKFLSNPERAVEILGGIQSEATLRRLDEAAGLGETVLQSKALEHPRFPGARVRTPLILKVDAADEAKYTAELFGPIAIIVAVDDSRDAIARATRTARRHGALTAAVYSTDPEFLRRAEEACAEAGVALSCNLTGNIFVNQSAAFSDFHATGANPAANASLCDAAFVAGRFRVVQSRIPVAA